MAGRQQHVGRLVPVPPRSVRGRRRHARHHRVRRRARLLQPVPQPLQDVPAVEDAPVHPADLRGGGEAGLRRARAERGRLPEHPQAHLPWRRSCGLRRRLPQRTQDQGDAHCDEVGHAGGRERLQRDAGAAGARRGRGGGGGGGGDAPPLQRSGGGPGPVPVGAGGVVGVRGAALGAQRASRRARDAAGHVGHLSVRGRRALRHARPRVVHSLARRRRPREAQAGLRVLAHRVPKAGRRGVLRPPLVGSAHRHEPRGQPAAPPDAQG
mmetsp:Transcript_41881/g.129192  ORF Transcript_41881/g.129192 Transcript_41881/m.129192 type:complete len:267 (+) Transcript_41881:887-1687(+)